MPGGDPTSSDLPPRYVPQRPLPPYTYVPGRTPHPVSDPAGHSYGVRPEPAPSDSCEWSESENFLWGVDLFNAGYYWEAHEAWESVWLAVGRTGEVARFLKGLIKLAAAGVKAYEGNAAGVQRHARRAAQLLWEKDEGVADRMGMSEAALREVALSAAEAPPLCDGTLAPIAGMLGAIRMSRIDGRSASLGE